MILDTDGLSALADGDPALQPILRRAAQIAVPVIVLGEYRYGISQSRFRKQYEQWLSEYLPGFRILDVDERTTVSYSASRTNPGNRNHSCPVLAAFLASMLLALLLMAASSSFPTRSSDRARCAATQISTTFRTSSRCSGPEPNRH